MPPSPAATHPAALLFVFFRLSSPEEKDVCDFFSFKEYRDCFSMPPEGRMYSLDRRMLSLDRRRP
jgi:hypothetical protein